MLRRCILTTLTLATLACPVASYAATLYKWTDESGTTHFSERPPADVTEFEKVTNRYQPGNSPVPTPASAADNQQQQSSDHSDAASSAAESASSTTSATPDRCEKARKNLEALTSFARIRIEEEGKLRFLTEDEIITRRMETQAVLDDECN